MPCSRICCRRFGASPTTHSEPTNGGNWPATPRPLDWWHCVQFTVKIFCPAVAMASGDFGSSGGTRLHRLVVGFFGEHVALQAAVVGTHVVPAPQQQHPRADGPPGDRLESVAADYRRARHRLLRLAAPRVQIVQVERLALGAVLVEILIPLFRCQIPVAGRCQLRAARAATQTGRRARWDRSWPACRRDPASAAASPADVPRAAGVWKDSAACQP